MKRKFTSSLILIGCFTVIALAAVLADPTSTYWIGAQSNDWFINSNWSFRAPDCTLDAYVNNGGKPEIDIFKAEALSLTLGSSAGDSGNLVVDGTNGGRLDVCGDVYVGNQGSGNVTINHGGIVTSENVFIATSSGSLLSSHGSVTVTDTSSIWSIYTGGLAQLLIGVNPSGANGGMALLNVSNGGLVVVYNYSSGDPAVLVGPSGTLTGDGTVEMSSGSSTQMEVRGTLAPSSATLTIGGDLTFTSAAPGDAPTMECTVTYGDVTTTPKVAVSGTASLTGKLTLTMTGNTFTSSTAYTLLHSDGPRNNTFSTYSIKYGPNNQCFTPVITYDAHNVYLYLQPCT